MILKVPWKMAYGLSGSPPHIGPKHPLIYELEVLEIVDPDKDSDASTPKPFKTPNFELHKHAGVKQGDMKIVQVSDDMISGERPVLKEGERAPGPVLTDPREKLMEKKQVKKGKLVYSNSKEGRNGDTGDGNSHARRDDNDDKSNSNSKRNIRDEI